jgi:hypothetical protein
MTPRSVVGKIVCFLSAEWLLTCLKWENGGDVIAIRSAWIAVVIYLPVLGLKDICDPNAVLGIDLKQLPRLVPGTLPWLGAIFAGAYASLQSRYSSQWTYLAGVYNRIKETDARGGVEPERMAEWKAGFIEDAEDLHLLGKPMFTSVATAWGSEARVRAKFLQFTSDGANRWRGLVKRYAVPPIDGSEEKATDAAQRATAGEDGEPRP